MNDGASYRIKMAIFGLILLFLIDIYAYQAIRIATHKLQTVLKVIARTFYWTVTGFAVFILLWINIVGIADEKTKQWIIVCLGIVYFSKIFLVLVLFVDDVRRGLHFSKKYYRKIKEGNVVESASRISRSEFFAKAALFSWSIPVASLSFGIITGAHNFHVRRRVIYLPNLPKAFDGISIGQLSDIHAGSLFNKTAIRGGVDMLLNEKPDVILFTGDLVNVETKEVSDYINTFDKIKAPLGVFSVTGNHDYGNYRQWPSVAAKQQNLRDMLIAHKQMGYDLLMNEHRMLELNGDKLAIIGVENWGIGPPLRFPKYGKLREAHANTNDAAVKILLSHDPTHWDAQIRPEFPDIDLTFAGHTHGYQLGVSLGNFTWSPAQYRFKQWADLYQEGDQFLYVNRGFGCIGYPGRIGMPPELTIIELKRGTGSVSVKS
ncbi:metallophosphoesterase [Chryseolinea sp. H1M3-3]|uniref:metallophosphoesterase n=1 Tax=Chryseolinea sp. H1M3-3 TaxID=3034144 RepID=UPI0023EDAAF9|nr:metallophosphoesterase [Chryseolinea sp. H1M3-3]